MSVATPLSRRFALRRFGGGAVCCLLLPALAPRPAAARRVVPLIMIDPGHGGRDPGASGLAGTLEKEVTLGTALSLRARLEARGHYRVGMTRAQDIFLSLEDRTEIALTAGAALFLSLHADTMPSPSVRGAAVYTLARTASDAMTEALAIRENTAGPAARAPVAPEVSDILTSLAGRAARAGSSRMARDLVRDLGQAVPLLPLPRRHANFSVLRSAGIPSVLVEMGFLSNPVDEAALNDAGHRDRVARAMARAVDAWFTPGDAEDPGTG